MDVLLFSGDETMHVLTDTALDGRQAHNQGYLKSTKPTGPLSKLKINGLVWELQCKPDLSQ